MDITNRFKNALAALRNNVDTNVGIDPNTFLRYGSQRRMPSTWTVPQITDEDFYTGYGFAVVNKRANRTVVLGKKFLFTEATEAIVKKANESKASVTHPYLDLIRKSTDFAERDFWYDISTYLDLEGIYYLMAVRTVTQGGKVGNIQKFSLLNPYWVRQVVDSKGILGGYVENNPYLGSREIPKEMIIPIKLLNPFDPSKPYSLADAARDSQFTMKQANDFARESINGNLNAPGILSSAIELPDDQFDNFVERIKGHNRGEPLFGNGSGTVSWVDMQTDLDKAALDKINSINRDALLAISGLSKTGVGVEESGTGREVSRTQKDDFTENAIMPQVENIIDALNLDYRRYYDTDYKKNNYVISLDNPLETSHDAEKVDVDIRDAQFELLKTLINEGYEYDIASKFSKGLIDITDLGKPTNPPKPTIPDIPPVTPIDPSIKKGPLAVDPTAPPGESPPPAPKPTKPATKPVKPAKPVAPAKPVVPVKKTKKKNAYEDKKFDVYEGHPIPVLQYLEENAEQVTPLTEKSSFIYSTEPVDKVRIDHIDEDQNSIVAVINENSFIKLGEFAQNADKVVILAKLNKRYKNQLVAVKKKIDLTHNCVHDLPEVVKNAAFDKQAQISSNTNDLLTSAQAAEDKLYEWYLDQINAGDFNPHPTSLEEFINSLTLPFAVYFTVMFPIYASHHVVQTAKQLGIKDDVPIVAMTDEVKQSIADFARKEATSHINTLKTDIENALAIIRSKTSDPNEIRTMFAQAFKDIQARRGMAIANNAAARIFNISQFEADLQFLTRAGLVNQAFKVLFSLTGDPCPFCASLITSTNAKPIPFTQAFASIGDTLTAEGKTMRFSYEDIIAGNVHPNCHCAYKLIIENVA